MADILNSIDLSEIHDCEKCRGKLVCIAIDYVGVERCAYCGALVDYSGFIKRKIKEKYGKEHDILPNKST